ncbi:MAG: hypothetical protein HQL63_10885 [Magnetococcales bacterium]|nr:hypothetical protein [Magnetococcales bacterium]MBF0321607.1 hypothetical protein [Magnetococcales bacterium]
MPLNKIIILFLTLSITASAFGTETGNNDKNIKLEGYAVIISKNSGDRVNSEINVFRECHNDGSVEVAKKPENVTIEESKRIGQNGKFYIRGTLEDNDIEKTNDIVIKGKCAGYFNLEDEYETRKPGIFTGLKIQFRPPANAADHHFSFCEKKFYGNRNNIISLSGNREIDNDEGFQCLKRIIDEYYPEHKNARIDMADIQSIAGNYEKCNNLYDELHKMTGDSKYLILKLICIEDGRQKGQMSLSDAIREVHVASADFDINKNEKYYATVVRIWLDAFTDQYGKNADLNAINKTLDADKKQKDAWKNLVDFSKRLVEKQNLACPKQTKEFLCQYGKISKALGRGYYDSFVKIQRNLNEQSP